MSDANERYWQIVKCRPEFENLFRFHNSTCKTAFPTRKKTKPTAQEGK